MTLEEIKELKKGIALTASYYGRDLKPEVIGMMADDLSDLPFEKVSQAFLAHRRDPKNRVMPLPAQIRAIVNPIPDADAEAREAVEKIKIAIGKFGYPQGEAAKAFIGPVGWRIVEGMGGWMRVCESDFIHNPGLVAQARNRAADLISFGDSFRHEQTHLPPPENKPALESKKFQMVEDLRKHQAEKTHEITFEIPSDEERARMIQELLNKANRVEEIR